MGVGALAVGSTVVLMNAGAQASSQAFTLYSQINNTALQAPLALGSKTVAMTVTPATAAPGDPIEIEVSSPDLAFAGGPVTTTAANSAELDAVVTLDGTDYVLRGPQNTVELPANDGTVTPEALVFKAGWVVSSAPGGSTATSNTGGPSGTDAAATTGLGTAVRGAEATIVPLVAPEAGTYTIGLKALVLNAVAGSSTPALTNTFDSITNTTPGSGASCPATPTCIGPGGPTGSFATNTTDGTTAANGNLVFTTPVTLTVVDDGPTDPTPGATVTVTATETVQVPGPTVTTTEQVPGPTVTTTETVATATATATVTATETVPVPGPTVTTTEQVPGPTVTVTETVATATATVEVPGPTVTATESVPGPTVTETEQVPGPTVTTTEQVPGPTVTETQQVPGPTVTVTETAGGGHPNHCWGNKWDDKWSKKNNQWNNKHGKHKWCWDDKWDNGWGSGWGSNWGQGWDNGWDHGWDHGKKGGHGHQNWYRAADETQGSSAGLVVLLLVAMTGMAGTFYVRRTAPPGRHR